MCFNDWRIGRLIRTNVLFYQASGAPVFNIPQNSQRVGLTIHIEDPDTLEIANGTLNEPGSALGIALLDSRISVYHWTLATHGDFPTRAFQLAAALGNSGVVCVVESIAPEEYLAAALEQFRTEYGIKGF